MIKQAIIITGATSGIGLATARLMAKDHTVIGIGRDIPRLFDLKSISENIIPICADINDETKLKEVLKTVVDHKLIVKSFVHSAGIGLSQGFTNYNAEAVNNLFQTNVYSAFSFVDGILPHMLSNGGGNICFVSSTAGLHGYKYNGAYCATKHALIGMVRSLAKEHGKRGIVATSVCPGVVDTPMTNKTIKGLMKYKGLTKKDATAKLAAINPQNRIVPAHEVAEVIAFICSGKAPALSGSEIVLGGGE